MSEDTDYKLIFEEKNGDNLFNGPLRKRVLKENSVMYESSEKINKMLSHYKGLNDDRVFALISALIVENALDDFLSKWIPKYKIIKEDKSFTFSVKVQLALSLKLIPSHILNCIAPIRQIRNLFAHNIEIKTFDEAKQFNDNYFIDLHNKANVITSKWDEKNDKLTLEHLTTSIVLALNLHAIHIEKISLFIRNPKNVEEIIEK